jgi:hypothetical protein
VPQREVVIERMNAAALKKLQLISLGLAEGREGRCRPRAAGAAERRIKSKI